MKSLNTIALECGTDKATSTHGFTKTYERYFESIRHLPFTLLEIGVAAGGSLKMWREYFPNAKVYGIDNNPDCANYGEGIFIGNQNDLGFLDSVLEKIGAPNIIIDDGSHYGPDMIKTFDYLFPKMAPKGIYVVEDFHCAYDKTYGEAPPYGEGMSAVWNFFSYLAVDIDVHGRGMCGDKQFAIDHPSEVPPVPTYARLIEAMHIHTSLRIIERR